MQKLMHSDKAVLMAAFARLDVVALAAAIGTVCGVGLALLTIILLLKGAAPGTHIGPHLGMLWVYLPGYSVSWGGAAVGAIYGGIVGAAVGFVWAVLWNLTHYVYIILVAARAYWWRVMAE